MGSQSAGKDQTIMDNTANQQPESASSNVHTTVAAATSPSSTAIEESSNHKRKQSETPANEQAEQEEPNKRTKTAVSESTTSAAADKVKTETAATNSSAQFPTAKRKIDMQHRWRVNQMVEDYVELSSNMMIFPTNHLGSYGYHDNQQGKGHARTSYPLEHISLLGYLKSPLRRPTVIERWCPYEIALFEAGMAHYGKDFFQIHKAIQTKSTKEVIDFYYVWKKTSHYQVWKKEYVNPLEVMSDDEYGMTPVKKAPS